MAYPPSIPPQQPHAFYQPSPHNEPHPLQRRTPRPTLQPGNSRSTQQKWSTSRRFLAARQPSQRASPCSRECLLLPVGGPLRSWASPSPAGLDGPARHRPRGLPALAPHLGYSSKFTLLFLREQGYASPKGPAPARRRQQRGAWG